MTTTEPTSNPYTAAQGIWNERNRDLVTAKHNWQILAAVALLSNALLGVGVLWLASQSRVVPYIVRVDEAGQSMVVGAATEASVTDPKVIGWQLQEYLRDVRHVTADGAAQKTILRSVYERTAGPATGILNAHFREMDPFLLAKERTVVASVRNTLAIGERTWQVEWTELHRALDGKPLEEQIWTGRFEVVTSPPTTPEEIVTNPLGFRVRGISWSRKFAPQGDPS